MNAQNDDVIRMAKSELPPVRAFWSVTLYDVENGFFIPNSRKKYSVGENAGMKLDDAGGIAIYVAASKPACVPEENWLPINRGDEDIGAIMRIHVPDFRKLKMWSPPKADKLTKGTPGSKRRPGKSNTRSTPGGSFGAALLNNVTCFRMTAAIRGTDARSFL